ncbi:mercuric transport protein MerTP, partial [Algoriphagus sp.]|uniref:mercuric transport protein MerTP n=1 Tax=Algoriphagus sp. TaxID=1872435 RepID=UPI0034574357
SVGAGLIAAILASLCCITPVLSIVAGISGIAATFSWIEPFRPYLILLTLGILSFAWYQKLKPRTNAEIECDCETGEIQSFWKSKKFLSFVTVFAGLMLAFPSYSHIFYPESKSSNQFLIGQEFQLKQADFQIKGMTCAGCEIPIKQAIIALEGTMETMVSYEKKSAQVTFNDNSISLEAIIEAINKTGYTVVDSKVSDLKFQNSLLQPVAFKTLELSVKGMTCSGCEAPVTNSIGKLDGVNEVKTSYKDENTVVKYDPKKVNRTQIVEAISKVGFKVIEDPD